MNEPNGSKNGKSFLRNGLLRSRCRSCIENREGRDRLGRPTFGMAVRGATFCRLTSLRRARLLRSAAHRFEARNTQSCRQLIWVTSTESRQLDLKELAKKRTNFPMGLGKSRVTFAVKMHSQKCRFLATLLAPKSPLWSRTSSQRKQEENNHDNNEAIFSQMRCRSQRCSGPAVDGASSMRSQTSGQRADKIHSAATRARERDRGRDAQRN